MSILSLIVDYILGGASLLLQSHRSQEGGKHWIVAGDIANPLEGYGLCNGLAGAGYLFLELEKITGRQEYKDVAMSIRDAICMELEKMNSQQQGKFRGRRGRGYKENECCSSSLFFGIPGIAVYLADVLRNDLEGSCFPCFDLPRYK